MSLHGGNKRLRPVEWLDQETQQRIEDFLQGSVYCWCKNREGEWFGLRDLMGGVNFDWTDTPLYPLYEHYHDAGETSEKAVDLAGIDAGWILKEVLADDPRRFETRRRAEHPREYKWKG
ncbi:MAG: hypothetical protein COB85_02410 [Bacteroidetes bacterium]|nr:MAG: hypothetical protein COB85_02410 [Bacteroidota bacterium]